ncbi:hypothetical protein Sjap_005330 [Stephania japonica]|uniref:Uncharacterized protein n=1 Tax=Stephania japonica TaxID=461633 RepID=A0AAP0K655_9MAGN
MIIKCLVDWWRAYGIDLETCKSREIEYCVVIAILYVSDIKLIRTDTTLDLSQKAEKDTRSTHHDGTSTSPVVRSTPPSDELLTNTTLDLRQKAERGMRCERIDGIRGTYKSRAVNGVSLNCQGLDKPQSILQKNNYIKMTMRTNKDLLIGYGRVCQALAVVQGKSDAQEPQWQANVFFPTHWDQNDIAKSLQTHVQPIRLSNSHMSHAITSRIGGVFTTSTPPSNGFASTTTRSTSQYQIDARLRS